LGGCNFCSCALSNAISVTQMAYRTGRGGYVQTTVVAPGGALLFNGFCCQQAQKFNDCCRLYMAFVVNEEREAWVKGNERRLRAVK
jgi:hypothetical protein